MDRAAIEVAVDSLFTRNPDKVQQVKAKRTLVGWFVGQVMSETRGIHNPQDIVDVLNSKLDDDPQIGEIDRNG